MLNPILYTEQVVGDFLRYQLTTYPFADADLQRQLREMLNLADIRRSPLLRGPYVSLNRPFRVGRSIRELCEEGLLHRHLTQIAEHPHAYGHQEDAFRAIRDGHSTVISTGTGSGKTESFLFPIVSRCLELRDAGAPPGIVAVLIYPMNALAEDQLDRMREMLVGTGVTFGMYIGKTPEREADVTGERLRLGASRADWDAAVERREQQAHREQRNRAIHPPEERCSREAMRGVGGPPRILITNIKQLELLLTRHRDVELFRGANLEFLVFDEAHTFKGAQGAETACLVRRLRAFCGATERPPVCVAASATISDEGSPNAAQNFAARFFGIPAEGVRVVTEVYEDEGWQTERAWPVAPADPTAALASTLQALGRSDEGQAEAVRAAWAALGGVALSGEWQAALHERLAASELLFQCAALLRTPRALARLAMDLSERAGRPVSEAEIILYLALGAAARREERPLVRPVVHAFVRGIGGAVVTFPVRDAVPRLWLSAEDAVAAGDPAQPLGALPVKTCSTCGQHYFTHELADFEFTEDVPTGGELRDDRVFWRPLPKKDGGTRVTLFDRMVSEGEEPERTADLHLCRHCGTAHVSDGETCCGCGRQGPLVRLLAVQQRPASRHYLHVCITCGARGQPRAWPYREPARPLRAVTVSDAHVLGQNMIHYAERDRLLIFADNRQDAAFQAGWMRDHARRFRLRSLMLQRIVANPVTVGDLVAWLDRELDANNELSEALLPEVWAFVRKNSAPREHETERRYLLRVMVLREIATGVRQRIGLEPWGRMRVEYQGLLPDHAFFARWATVTGHTSHQLHDGVVGLLDGIRRQMIVFDDTTRVFGRIWESGAREVERGYVPEFRGVPKGLKFARKGGDSDSFITQWWSARGQTLARECARKWDVPPDRVHEFLEELWRLLTSDLRLLREAELLGSGQRPRPIRGTQGAHQIDADRLLLVAARGQYECDTCRRLHARPTPGLRCLAWRCNGTLAERAEDPDNYDLRIVDGLVGDPLRMVRAREHSAQVPTRDRETLERLFKSESTGSVNTLVCTPTLELGVDIGALDAVLMRNVPPSAANYWQRAGRAGRRHRIAVNITYARPASHDRAYFADPSRLLAGRVLPPRFNLRNPELVRKHVHALVLTQLHRLASPDGRLAAEAREAVALCLRSCFPPLINAYLFDPAGHVRAAPQPVDELRQVVDGHSEMLFAEAWRALGTTWPAEDRDPVMAEASIRSVLTAMPIQLAGVIRRLWNRLAWARTQIAQLNARRDERGGSLEPEEQALFRRCERLVARLRCEMRDGTSDEELADVTTFSVLASEGFLPGYGLEAGSILGAAVMPLGSPGAPEYLLPRPAAMAIREYVPGNLIYANQHKFVARTYHLDASEPVSFSVNLANEAIAERGSGAAPGAADVVNLRAIAMCDVDFAHSWHIQDEEEHRFQLPVMVLGTERGPHGEGMSYRWGGRVVQFRRQVAIRLVNIGVEPLLRSEARAGYPLCLVTGQSRSPLASAHELDHFRARQQERYRRAVEDVGFYTDIAADTLSIQRFPSRSEAYSVMECLRLAAARCLDMEVDDLQILCLGSMEEATVDGLLYDPMPGGSGLLEQIVENWETVVAAALTVASSCTSSCVTACIDCLLHFRNAYYHRHLDRHVARTALIAAGGVLVAEHPIPARADSAGDRLTPDGGLTATLVEQRLLELFRRAGFPEPEAQRNVPLGHPFGHTTPDFFYADPTERSEGLCIYLDGLSDHIHGNATTQERDRRLRASLRQQHYDVIEIPATHLHDADAMADHFYRMARFLMGRAQAESLRGNRDWFVTPEPTP